MAEQPNISQLVAGMNTDSVMSQLKEGQYTYALNAVVENFDGQSLTLQNEQANAACFKFPDGYKVIGARNIIQLNKTLFLLTNPTTGDSEVGFGWNETCVYETQISDVGNECKFNFSVDHPVHKIIIKSDNCSTQAYFTDDFNPRRYIDFDDMPWVEIVDPTNSFKRIKIVGKLDCNKLNVQPSYSIPQIEGIEETVGGTLITGVYQGGVQYANALGEGLTSIYNITNPIGVFEQKESVDFNLPTAKAITFKISHLDTSGLYEYFNLIVVKTINNIPTVDVVGTFPISSGEYTYTYTGITRTSKTINVEDLFLKFPYYDRAGDLFEVDNVLGWGILSEAEEPNHQKFWSKVHLYWESYKLPYNQFQAYNNGINVEKYKGYMRDETYALEGCILYTNGKQGKSCHIPCRLATSEDLEPISTSNMDNSFSTGDKCDPPLEKPRWKVYNTAKVIHTVANALDNCYVGEYQFGEFAYSESTDLYPNNSLIWGDLAGKPIRHHRFPDVLVSPIHDNNTSNDPSFEHSVFPIGIRIDAGEFIKILKESFTPEEISQIAGFKITRGNRASNNKSIIAKGLLQNVGTSTRENKTYYYPNYPFNDLRPDPYYSTTKLENHVGFVKATELAGFGDDGKSHFVFHSPDTHFYQPSIDNTGEILKLETIEYGQAKGHFVKVYDNAEYKFLTPRTVNAAAGLAIASGVVIGAGMFGWPEYNMSSGIPTYTSAIDLFERLSPFTNFGYTFNSVGNYSNSYPIPNSGNKQRAITYNKYVIDGLNGVENGKVLNNYRRESSIYISTGSGMLYPHEYSPTIPVDNSRFNLASLGDTLAPEIERTSNICSYYGSIKREILNQWGQMYSYDTIDTGFYQDLKDDKGEFIDNYPLIFGGDVFINRFAYKSKIPFFRDNTVLAPNQSDIAYDELGNLNFPMFWISTKAQRYDIDVDKEISDVTNEFIKPSFFNILANILGGGAKGSATAMRLVTKIFSEIHDKLGRKNVNMDRGDDSRLFEQGLFYLFAYGIPYFFCESEVNVDYRQATNQREGNFYPNVGGDIPDDWLQEKSVPIIQDNTYTYNKTYSKQNRENFFAHLREDYDPTKLCNTDFPNRAIWSEQANVEETKNNWLVYKPSSRYDFPKSFGKLIALDGIENRQVIARFENKTLMYNALYTAPTSAGQVYLGKPLFDTSVPPLDYADTDMGYIGSQHKLFLKTEMGHIQTDAKRGQIFLLQGQRAKELGEAGMTRFFGEFLKFDILKTFPDYNIDNHFKGVGLTGVYDSENSRILLTKLDYTPLDSSLIIKDGKIGKPVTSTTTVYPKICPDGYEYINENCVKSTYTPATKISDVDFIALNTPRTEYTIWGSALYTSFSADGTGTYVDLPSNHVWTNIDISLTDGPLNRTGIWNSVSGDPIDTWVGVTKIVTNPNPTPKVYYIGMGADNYGRISLNCSPVMTMDPAQMMLQHTPQYIGITFRKWHVYPITLNPGVNYLTIENWNVGSVGILGCEIYDNTEAELFAATSLSDLKIIFTTADLFGKKVESFNYTCGSGACSDRIVEIDGSYYCPDTIFESPNHTPIVISKTEFVEVPFTDVTSFCNNSFTISYNFKTQSWVSFHSYLPNYYVGNSKTFFSGDNSISEAWKHNDVFTKFNNYFNTLYPYIIEYPIYFKGTDEILQNIKDYSKILKYTDFQEFIETDDVYFSEAIIYNNQQCSGTLKLVKKPKNSISNYTKYPIYNSDSKEILYTKSNSFYQFNTFWALQKSSQQPMWKKTCKSLSIYKEINNENMNYSKRSFNKAPIMAKDCRIRLINNTTDEHKFISQFIITPSMTSYK